MTGQNDARTVGQLPNVTRSRSPVATLATWLVWLLWVASLGVAVTLSRAGGEWTVAGVAAVDGLTAVMWVVVTLFSGLVHSYSRRYMAGSEHLARFFGWLLAFTLAALVLVAADHVVLFAGAWLAMGLVMAALVGTVRGWRQARAAAAYTRRYFIAGSALLSGALAVLWWETGEATVSGIVTAADTMPTTTWLVAAGGLLLAAMVQSALVPFHTWLLSSMTAPTPASALMHAGFVNAGGILLVRFGPVVTVDAWFMLAVVVVGAASALLGKLLKSVQTDVKRALGCSTTGQMGFMLMQAGLGFFGAALTHLILHGFYKAYLFLGSGGRVTHTSPAATEQRGSVGLPGGVVTLLTAVAGGVLFALLTGKGTALDSGVLLTGLVALTTLHATRGVVRRTGLPRRLRYGVVVLVFLPSIAVYAGAYLLITGLMADTLLVTAPADLTAVHALVAAAFGLAYVAVETGLYRRSRRLYVWLLTATQPPTGTLLTATEEYDEY